MVSNLVPFLADLQFFNPTRPFDRNMDAIFGVSCLPIAANSLLSFHMMNLHPGDVQAYPFGVSYTSPPHFGHLPRQGPLVFCAIRSMPSIRPAPDEITAFTVSSTFCAICSGVYCPSLISSVRHHHFAVTSTPLIFSGRIAYNSRPFSVASIYFFLPLATSRRSP